MEKSAFIMDNTLGLLQAIIQNDGKDVSIRLFSANYELLGYINLHIQENNRIFLSEIYCYDDYRSLGLASKLSELADYVLKDYKNYMIRGIYYPTQMSSDINKTKSYEELDDRAKSFYEKNGYTILTYEDYVNNKDKYSLIDEKLDFKVNEKKVTEIVYKIIKDKQHNYFENDGIICYNDDIKKL